VTAAARTSSVHAIMLHARTPRAVTAT
jgi:hypothetical protein